MEENKEVVEEPANEELADALLSQVNELQAKLKEYEQAYSKLAKRLGKLSKAYSNLLNTYLDDEE